MKKGRKYYLNYKPGLPFAKAFDGEGIPLLTMDHLRNQDYPISRHFSYERTVDEFLFQLAGNVSLSLLKEKPDMVILLNEEGALIREDYKWSLLFTPDRGEGLTLAEDADLYPILQNILAAEKEGTICRIDVPERSFKTLMADMAPFNILDEYCQKQPGRYLSVAERIVYEGPEELYRHVPVARYNKMATVDKDEIENYHTIKALLDDYALQCENASAGENVQPLSIAVFGPPGSGKSFGVKQIAATCGKYEVSSLNISQYEDPAEMFEALDEALNCTNGSIPLVFFDEFDSELKGKSRGWLRYFLAPMQDGEYTIRGKTRIINHAVFVFAGGTAESFDTFLPDDDDADAAAVFAAVKGPDFVSRLKGTLNIKGLNPVSITDKTHIIRRAMLLRQQIVRQVSGVMDGEDGLVSISRSLLSALLRVSEYRHGARSLEFILAMCRLSGVSRFTPSCLPLENQLNLHLDVQDFQRKLSFEQIMGTMVETYAKAAHENYRQKMLQKLEAAAEKNGSEKIEKMIAAEPEMQEWDQLDEFYKESYRSQIRYLGEHLVSWDINIGLRPIVPNAPDTIRELYGPVLEEIAEIEHNRWMKDKRESGWKYGASDPELKLSPELVPYSELPDQTKDYIRQEVRHVPEQLQEVGYELYYKY